MADQNKSRMLVWLSVLSLVFVPLAWRHSGAPAPDAYYGLFIMEPWGLVHFAVTLALCSIALYFLRQERGWMPVLILGILGLYFRLVIAVNGDLLTYIDTYELAGIMSLWSRHGGMFVQAHQVETLLQWPGASLLWITYSQLSGIDTLLSSQILSGVTNTVLVVSIYMVSRRICPQSPALPAAVAIAFSVNQYVFFFPFYDYYYAFGLAPLFFWTLWESKSLSILGVALILYVALLVGHPFYPTVLTISMLGSAVLGSVLCKRSASRVRVDYVFPLLASVLFVTHFIQMASSAVEEKVRLSMFAKYTTPMESLRGFLLPTHLPFLVSIEANIYQGLLVVFFVMSMVWAWRARDKRSAVLASSYVAGGFVLGGLLTHMVNFVKRVPVVIGWIIGISGTTFLVEHRRFKTVILILIVLMSTTYTLAWSSPLVSQFGSLSLDEGIPFLLSHYDGIIVPIGHGYDSYIGIFFVRYDPSFQRLSQNRNEGRLFITGRPVDCSYNLVFSSPDLHAYFE